MQRTYLYSLIALIVITETSYSSMSKASHYESNQFEQFLDNKTTQRVATLAGLGLMAYGGYACVKYAMTKKTKIKTHTCPCHCKILQNQQEKIEKILERCDKLEKKVVSAIEQLGDVNKNEKLLDVRLDGVENRLQELSMLASECSSLTPTLSSSITPPLHSSLASSMFIVSPQESQFD